MLEIASKEKFNEKCARTILSQIEKCLADKPSCTVVLAGGSTPRSVYEMIVMLQSEYSIDWQKCLFFIGDERHVPYHDPAHNGRMADQSLLEPLQIMPEKKYFIDTTLSLAEAADQYTQQIKALPDILAHGFDIVLLGLGADGHTLSLFPGRLPAGYASQLVLGYVVDSEHGGRITLTPTLVNRSAYVLFMVTGTNKAKAVYEVAQNELAQATDFPAKLIRPAYDRIHFIVDEDAASMLDACGC